jgi:hypothetical protein
MNKHDNLHAKYHMPSSNGQLVNAMEPNAREIHFTATKLLFCILQFITSAQVANVL